MPDGRRASAGQAHKPPLLARARYRSARAARLVSTPTTIAATDPDGHHVIALDDIAAVMRIEDECGVVLGNNGCAIVLGELAFRGSREILDRIIDNLGISARSMTLTLRPRTHRHPLRPRADG